MNAGCEDGGWVPRVEVGEEKLLFRQLVRLTGLGTQVGLGGGEGLSTALGT